MLRRAFGDTKTLYGWGSKTILLVVLPSVLTIALDFLRLDDAEFQRHLLTVAYGLLAPVIVALLIFLWNLALAPSRIDSELREQIGALQRSSQTREDTQIIADLLQARFQAGEAIRDSQESARIKAKKALKWHKANLREFEEHLPRDELFMYQTIVADEKSFGRGSHPIVWAQERMEKLDNRLAKLRLMIGRYIRAVEDDTDSDDT